MPGSRKESWFVWDSIHRATEGFFTSLELVLPNEEGGVTMQNTCQAAPLAPPPLVRVHYLCFLWLYLAFGVLHEANKAAIKVFVTLPYLHVSTAVWE